MIRISHNIEEFINYLYKKYSNLNDIIKTFEVCSKYGSDKYLVNSQTKTINFDNLTEWRKQKNPPQSADSLSFSQKYVYLIEFKSGDRIKYELKIEKLVKDVSGKINDSDSTLTSMYEEAFEGKSEGLEQRFCLVVDSKNMGITPLVSTLSKLSLSQNNNEKEKILFERVLPDLEGSVKNMGNYSGIEIWYSEIFDKYIDAKKIYDMNEHRLI